MTPIIGLIPGVKVDLVEPFPEDRLGEMHRWLKATRPIAATGDFPQELEAFETRMRELLPRIRSWAVLDKTDGALIGVVMFEPVGAMGGKSYVAARRRSWGKGLLEEAAHLGIREVFRNPEIGYIFGFVAGNNAPARAFNERIGMRLKNVLPDYVLQAGELHDMRIYEITRERWTH